MEKNQYKLVLDVLKKFEKYELLDDIVLIGSWAALFYKDYFNNKRYVYPIRTRDVDFAVQRKSTAKMRADIPSLLESHGFITNFVGRKGHIRLEHPDLMLEFLVPEIGRGSDLPFKLPQYGLNAQPLRYMSMLLDNTVQIKIENIKIMVPHPAAYALHKFIIFKRRVKPDKAQKDIEGALNVFNFCLQYGDSKKIHLIFNSLHQKWRLTIIKNLESIKENEIVNFLKSI